MACACEQTTASACPGAPRGPSWVLGPRGLELCRGLPPCPIPTPHSSPLTLGLPLNPDVGTSVGNRRPSLGKATHSTEVRDASGVVCRHLGGVGRRPHQEHCSFKTAAAPSYQLEGHEGSRHRRLRQRKVGFMQSPAQFWEEAGLTKDTLN